MRSSRQVIAASPADLKSNRLGLMSQAQLQALHAQLATFDRRLSELMRRSVTLAGLATLALVLLSIARVIFLPLALLVEIVVVALLLVISNDINRFVKQLALDREAETVRIIKGRTSRATLRPHILYYSLRIELQSYKLLDASLARSFVTGELYQFYILPQSRVIIAAESVGEKDPHYR